jgi:hypothetical protein
MNKRGQTIFGLSFGMVFSILIIIMIIAVAFYAINSFLDIDKCAQAGLLFESVQDEIDRAWTSGQYSQTHYEKFPSGISEVCFGDISLPEIAPITNSEHFEFYQAFNDADPNAGTNMFLYPIEEACGGELFAKTLEHVKIDKFFCADKTTDGSFTTKFSFNDRVNNFVVVTKN